MASLCTDHSASYPWVLETLCLGRSTHHITSTSHSSEEESETSERKNDCPGCLCQLLAEGVGTGSFPTSTKLLLCSSVELGSGSREWACPNRKPNQTESRWGREGSARVLVVYDTWAVKEKGVGATLSAGTFGFAFLSVV